MKNNLFALLLAIGSTMPSFASEVFVDISFKDNEKIYRVLTDDENNRSIGLFSEPEKRTNSYFIDNIGNHRFIRKSDGADVAYTKSEQPIYRQIFDGPAAESDRGRAGNATCYDSRDKLVSGENGKIVYRTPSVVYSSGTGKLVSDKEAKSSIVAGECNIVEGKKWYKIPNGSWYQTWNQASGSYDIYFDKWEEKPAAYYEECYRRSPFYMALKANLPSISTKKLSRAKVDGALEEIEGGSLSTILEAEYKHNFYLVPDFNNRANKIGCYCWFGTGKGSFFVGDKAADYIKPLIESSDPENRFVCCGTSITALNKYYILGTDVLREWLKKSGIPSDKAECTNVVSVPLQKTLKTIVFVYSRPENCIYRFIIDETNNYEVGLPKKLNVDFNVMAMTIGSDGSVFLVPEVVVKPKPTLENLDGIEMETCLVDESDAQAPSTNNVNDESQESYEVRTKMLNLITTDAECTIVLSRAYYQDFYELPFGSDTLKKLNYSISLGKEFFSCKASFKKVSLATLDAELDVLLEVAKKSGNHIGEVVDTVPGFTNTFKKPEGYFIAIDNKK